MCNENYKRDWKTQRPQFLWVTKVTSFVSNSNLSMSCSHQHRKHRALASVHDMTRSKTHTGAMSMVSPKLGWSVVDSSFVLYINDKVAFELSRFVVIDVANVSNDRIIMYLSLLTISVLCALLLTSNIFSHIINPLSCVRSTKQSALCGDTLPHMQKAGQLPN